MPDATAPLPSLPGTQHPDEVALEHVRVRLPLTLATRAAAEADTGAGSLLDLARANAPDPSIFDEHPPVFFDVRASDNTLDSFFTRMMPSTLKNYARDAGANGGVPFLDSHKTGTVTQILGRTVRGVYTRGGADRPHRVVVTVLTQPTLNESQRIYYDLLRSGQARDVSVGFKDGRMVCSICGGAMLRWFRSDPGKAACYHIPGVEYEVVDSSGTPTGDRVRAEGLIEDAGLGELSGVHHGSNENAEFLGFKKARQMADAGVLTPATRAAVEHVYGLILPQPARLYFAGGDPNVPTAELGRAAVTSVPRHEEDEMPEPERAPASAEEITRVRQAEADRWQGELTGTLRLAGIELAAGQDVLALTRSLAEEVVRLRPRAEDGEKWRAELIRAAVAEGVRAFGDDFNQERQRTRLERMAPEDIQLETDSWAAIAARALPAGQATKNDAGEGTGKDEADRPRAIPRDAYRTTGRRAG